MHYRIFFRQTPLPFLGCGPEGASSPVEHGGNLYVHTSVHPSIRPLPEAPQRLDQASSGLSKAGSGLSKAGSDLSGAGSGLSEAGLGLSEAGFGLSEAGFGLSEAVPSYWEA